VKNEFVLEDSEGSENLTLNLSGHDESARVEINELLTDGSVKSTVMWVDLVELQAATFAMVAIKP